MRRIRLRQADPAPAKLAAGVIWALPDSRQWCALSITQNPEPKSFDGMAFQSDRPALMLATGRGTLQLFDLVWLSVASGIPLDSAWPAPALADMVRLAIASLPPGMRAALGGACAWQNEISPSEANPDRRPAFFLLSLLALDGTQHSVKAAMSKTDLAGWLQQPEWQPLVQPNTHTDSGRLQTSGVVTLASLTLSCTDLEKLQVGDALRLTLAPEPTLPAKVDLGRWRMCGRLGSGHFSFHQWECISMNNLHRDTHDVPPEDHPDRQREFPEEDEDYGEDDGGLGGAVPPLEDLPVAVTIIAGRLRMNLQSLRALQPGQTVALGGDALPRVELRAGGHLLARGELVELCGSLAVEIVELGRA